MLCAPEVLEESALEVEEDTQEEEVEEFRAFLDTVSPDDFVNAPPEGPTEA